MNEAAGSQTMVDSSGNGRNGVIGANVQEGTALPGGGTGYRFPYKRPNTPPADPGHLATVPNSTALNPGTGDFAIEFRMRTTHSFGNVIQKGQAGAPGGYWHTVRCERTPSMVTMIIDGVVTSRNRNATGNISNTRPVTIAGKGNCDQVEITCDYFSGDIDYVRIETS